jgi:SPP1 family predicted phage head-tail adaptor
LNIGNLNKRILIEKSTSTQNAYGEPVQTWTTQRDCWARVEPVQGKEYYTAKQTASELDVRFIMRYTTVSINPKQRLIYNGLQYNINSVINLDEQNRELHLYCSRINT